MTFFILRPYKQKWMSDFDGWVFTLAGTLMLLEIINNKSVYIVAGVAGLSTMVILFIYAAYHKYESVQNIHTVN